jgi:hypothetical protein
VALLALSIVMMLVQLALWWYSRDVAITAARAGVAAARAEDAGAPAGTAAARAKLDRFGSTLDGSAVNVTVDGAEVQVTVTGHVPTLLPGWTLTVHQSAHGPKEGWTP